MEDGLKEKNTSFIRGLRSSILPVKEDDNPAVKTGKNLAFGIFLILAGCLSASIVLAILFVL